MDINTIELKVRRDFNNAICLMGVIPFSVFFYLLSNKTFSFSIFTGQTGVIVFITVIILLLGITTGRKMLWAIIKQLCDFNHKITSLQSQLIEKNRLAAVTETALALSHEVNNPLLIIRGNIDLLEDEVSSFMPTQGIKERFDKIKNHLERIRTVTDKLGKLKNPVSTSIHGTSSMIDISQSG